MDRPIRLRPQIVSRELATRTERFPHSRVTEDTERSHRSYQRENGLATLLYVLWAWAWCHVKLLSTLSTKKNLRLTLGGWLLTDKNQNLFYRSVQLKQTGIHPVSSTQFNSGKTIEKEKTSWTPPSVTFLSSYATNKLLAAWFSDDVLFSPVAI